MRIHGAVLASPVLPSIGAERPYGASRPLSILDLDLDLPLEHELLVRVEVAGVCHSDLSVVDGNRVRPTPMLLGHEAAGIVEGVGREVHDLHIGDRVVLTFLPRCETCDGCRSQGVRPCIPGSRSNTTGELLHGGRRLHHHGMDVHHHLGVSAFASHAVVDRGSVVRVDHDVPPDVAAVMGCAVLTGGGAVLNCGRPSSGDTVAIVGLGGVGMAALITALAIEGVSVIAVDTVQEKLDKARLFGATAAFTPGSALDQGAKAGVVIEAAGSVRAFETALALTAPGGRTVTVGLPAPDTLASVAPTSLVAEGRSIVGSYLGSAVPQRDIPVFVDLWRRGRLPVEELITSRVELGMINEALDALARGAAIRQIIEFPSEELTRS